MRASRWIPYKLRSFQCSGGFFQAYCYLHYKCQLRDDFLKSPTTKDAGFIKNKQTHKQKNPNKTQQTTLISSKDWSDIKGLDLQTQICSHLMYYHLEITRAFIFSYRVDKDFFKRILCIRVWEMCLKDNVLVYISCFIASFTEELCFITHPIPMHWVASGTG